jgi:hypothetical protein
MEGVFRLRLKKLGASISSTVKQTTVGQKEKATLQGIHRYLQNFLHLITTSR